MGYSPPKHLSRRTFLKATAQGAIALTSADWIHSLAGEVSAATMQNPKLGGEIEPNPILKVLRWNEFVRSEKEIWLKNTERWEKLTGGRVETDFLPWTDLRPRAALEATIGTGHDIVFGFHDDPHLYSDRLVDLTQVAEYLGKKYDGWFPVCEMYGQDSSKKHWLALPIGLPGTCLIYRKSVVDEIGCEKLPESIPELLQCAKAMSKKGYYTGFPLGHAVGDANGWTHWWLWSYGGRAVEADGRTVAINSPETIQALDGAIELYETMIPGVNNWLDPDNNKAFLNGDISLTLNGSSIVYAAKNNHPQIYEDITVTNMPIGPVGYPTELSSISLGYIFKHSTVPNAAMHYLAFMLEEEQYGEWISKSYGYITHTLKHFNNLPSWQQDPRITPYRDCAARMLPNSHPGPLGTKSAATMSEYIIVDMFAEACTGICNPQQAALVAEKRLARLYR